MEWLIGSSVQLFLEDSFWVTYYSINSNMDILKSSERSPHTENLLRLCHTPTVARVYTIIKCFRKTLVE